jgi:F420-dependent oxidoreductase-like protein
MKLGINLGYFGLGSDSDNIEVAQEADRLGYATCWAAEVYGSDAATVLAYVAAKTERIDVGSAIFQIPARTPTMTAMTAATLDTLSGGRFRLGLGVSGPQVSEGWYGVRFDKPLARTREYVEIVRAALSREKLDHQGEHWTLPLPDGPGKPLKLTIRPVRDRIPIYIAAIGPKNLEQTGGIADGWLPVFFAPEHAEISLAPLRDGRGAPSTVSTWPRPFPSPSPSPPGTAIRTCGRRLTPSAPGAAPGGIGPGLEERLAMLQTLMEAAELAGVLDSDVPSS